MSSEGVVPTVGATLHRLSTWFDPETAGVVTILLGLFQVVLSVPLAYADHVLPKLFILPVVLGLLIVTGGSFTVANVKNPSRQMLRGCAYSNVLGLLGTLLAFCLYCYSLSLEKNEDVCVIDSSYNYYGLEYYRCPGELLSAFCWSLIFLLLLYDIVAVVLHCLLSVSALKALKKD
ncbi:uncharacterized protein LOC117776040 [Hippoglossus hippoglossus]|uniref:uncharacterized protein LOC117776040 n=1 Tax=Hippoglossus hippoglossus TaxID=8267 RepID=UPI00148CC25A|nr:uncharacterized protein LOC117776040 [Hippoglossus hippoglossus]